MSPVPPELVAWLDGVLGAEPVELDHAAGALLRVCRDHAAALRRARSAQLDRVLAPAVAALTGWLARHVAGDWVAPPRLAAPAADVWRVAAMHEAEVGAAAARAVVARALAEALDDAVGHRYVSIFRRRGDWRVAPGAPFPVVQPDLRRLFAGPLVTLPDRREAPVDRTRRLALAPAADGIDVALDLARAALVAPPAPDATVAAALPIASPARELAWEATTGALAAFRDVAPVAPAEVAARIERLLVDACARGAALVVLPELAVDAVALARIRAALARQPAPPVVVAGTRHVRTGGVRRNVATLLAPGGEATHAKFNPYFAGEQREDIAIVPAEVRAHGVADDAGRLVFATVVLVCKDFLAPGAQRALEALRPTLVVVPAWSQKTAAFETDAIGLTGRTQATVLVVNQAEPPAPGEEDPAVLILTRPLAGAPPAIVRRTEVAPPALVTAPLGSGSAGSVLDPAHG